MTQSDDHPMSADATTKGRKDFADVAHSKGVDPSLFSGFTPAIQYEEEDPNPNLPTIVYVHTGGTLMMVESKEIDGALSFTDAIDVRKTMDLCNAVCGTKKRFNTIGVYLSNVDSKELGVEHWRAMLGVVKAFYHRVHGVVIGHGTHTAEYTAAAMSFGLRNLSIPIIITASQIPIAGYPGSDGLQNLTGAMQIAAYGDLAEVGVFANGKIHRGTRVVKTHDNRLEVFSSRVIDPIGYFVASGMNVDLRPGIRKRNEFSKTNLVFKPDFTEGIVSAVLTPGTTDTALAAILDAASVTEKIRGIVLSVYGSGAVRRSLGSILISKRHEGIPVFLTSACADSGATPSMIGHDEDATALQNAGVVILSDMTGSAATVKLMSVLADTDTSYPELSQAEKLRIVDQEMVRNYAGETTEITSPAGSRF